MSDLRTYLGLYLRGDAAAKAREVEQAFDKMGKRGAASVGALSRSLSLAGQGIDNLANRYTAILSGAAGAGAVKMVSDLQTRMTYLGIQAGASADQMERLKKKVFETAMAPDIRVDPSGILDGIDVIIEKTGNLKLAEDNIRNIALLMRATQAEGRDAGGVVAQNYEKFDIDSAEMMLAALDHTVNAAKAGAVSVADLASKGPQLAASYAITGRTGLKATAEIDAMIQMMIKGAGGVDQATTAFEAFMRTLNDGQKRKLLTARGIRLFDPDDPNRMRSGVEIIKDIITKTNGDVVKISKIFDGEAMRGLNPIIAEFKKTGRFDSLDQFLGVAADGKAIMKDASDAAKTFGASMEYLRTAWKSFADANLADPVQALADALNSINPEKLQQGMRAAAWVAGGLGAAIVAKKGVDAARWGVDTARWIKGGKGGAGAAAAAAGGAAGGLSGPMPVMVVNWPGQFGGGGMGLNMPDAAKVGKGKTGLRGLAARGGQFLGMMKGNAALAVGLGAIDIGSSLVAGDNRGAVAAGGRTIGALGGAAAGAVIGSVVPVVGTVAGGLAGGMIGAMGGDALFQKLYDWLAKDKAEKAREAEPIEAYMKVDFANLPAGARITTMDAKGAHLDVGKTIGTGG